MSTTELYFVCFVQTNGTSNGLIPMLRVYNNTARYVDQGGNKVRFGQWWPCTCFALDLVSSIFNTVCVSLCYSLGLTASWGICHLLGALASRCLWLPGYEKEPRLWRKGIWYADTESRRMGGGQKSGDILLCSLGRTQVGICTRSYLIWVPYCVTG